MTSAQRRRRRLWKVIFPCRFPAWLAGATVRFRLSLGIFWRRFCWAGPSGIMISNIVVALFGAPTTGRWDGPFTGHANNRGEPAIRFPNAWKRNGVLVSPSSSSGLFPSFALAAFLCGGCCSHFYIFHCSLDCFTHSTERSGGIPAAPSHARLGNRLCSRNGSGIVSQQFAGSVAAMAIH